jgi:hypothetical protein
MPLYNTKAYVEEAVRSILQDRDVDFEMIVVDDCSTDGSSEIVANIAKSDNRVRHIRLEKNGGMAAGLNRGVMEVRSPLITQMDSDDVSRPGRLAAQIAFMKEHPEVDYAGASLQYIDSSGVPLSEERDGHSVPMGPISVIENSELLKWKLPFGNVYANPTMVMRASVPRENPYTTEEPFRYCVDYEYWCRLNWKYGGSNIPKTLVNYRMHEQQGGRVYNDSQNRAVIEAARRCWSELIGQEVNGIDVVRLHDLSQSCNKLTPDDFFHLAGLLTSILLAFMEKTYVGGLFQMPGQVPQDYAFRIQRLGMQVQASEADIALLLAQQQERTNQSIQSFIKNLAA